MLKYAYASGLSTGLATTSNHACMDNIKGVFAPSLHYSMWFSCWYDSHMTRCP